MAIFAKLMEIVQKLGPLASTILPLILKLLVSFSPPMPASGAGSGESSGELSSEAQSFVSEAVSAGVDEQTATELAVIAERRESATA